MHKTNGNWNFPKFHARRHAFDDIKNKGAVRNFGTKISESMHQDIHVTPQLVKHDHRRTVATFIREQIDTLAIDSCPADTPEEEDVEPTILSNVEIGSKLKPITFHALEQSMAEDTAFERFRIKFGDFITPFQFLKVHYDSLSTWTTATDYLRCSPKFHGQPRYDCVLVKTEQRPFFARLLYLFSCTVEDKSHPFALILPLDAPTGRSRRTDKELRFRRVRAKTRKRSEFISVHSIIRGAVLVPDVDEVDEFIVFDVLDTVV
ncbi:hypothetical protein R3P38DRAFT_3524967 [Favolaschia claudopus]|uniref:Uncharacterized protein n=1 Tax=Favolaschia claudopus TaxID=2862362 RepID=A0AAW0BLG3_9AGAR